ADGQRAFACVDSVHGASEHQLRRRKRLPRRRQPQQPEAPAIDRTVLHEVECAIGIREYERSSIYRRLPGGSARRARMTRERADAALLAEAVIETRIRRI